MTLLAGSLKRGAGPAASSSSPRGYAEAAVDLASEVGGKRSSATSDLDGALDGVDRDGPSCGRVDVDETRVEDDRPSRHFEARRQAVEESWNDGCGVEADDAVDRTHHAQIGLVGRALRHDPLVGGWDVCVRTDDGTNSAVEVDAKSVLLAREFAVEVHHADRRQRLGGLLYQPIELREGVL